MINEGVWVGRAGKDPEVFTFENNKKTTITMACNRPTKDNKTDWFTVEAWGKQGEILAQYVKKGHLYGAIGSINIENYSDRNGVERTKVVIAARSIRLMNPKDNEQQQGAQQQAQGNADVFAMFGGGAQSDDDIPF